MLELAQFHCLNRRLSSIKSINAISTICWTGQQLFPIVPAQAILPVPSPAGICEWQGAHQQGT
jgi:hypothetical protein